MLQQNQMTDRPSVKMITPRCDHHLIATMAQTTLPTISSLGAHIRLCVFLLFLKNSNRFQHWFLKGKTSLIQQGCWVTFSHSQHFFLSFSLMCFNFFVFQLLSFGERSHGCFIEGWWIDMSPIIRVSTASSSVFRSGCGGRWIALKMTFWKKGEKLFIWVSQPEFEQNCQLSSIEFFQRPTGHTDVTKDNLGHHATCKHDLLCPPTTLGTKWGDQAANCRKNPSQKLSLSQQEKWWILKQVHDHSQKLWKKQMHLLQQTAHEKSTKGPDMLWFLQKSNLQTTHTILKVLQCSNPTLWSITVEINFSFFREWRQNLKSFFDVVKVELRGWWSFVCTL